jgi:hypothetical protein
MPDRLAIDHLKTHRTKVRLHKYVLSSSLHNRTNPLTLYVWGSGTKTNIMIDMLISDMYN